MPCEDHQFVGEYIPIVSLAFWQKLPADLQQAFTDLWLQNVAAYRADMAAAQSRARNLVQAHGIKIVVPTAEELAAVRRDMTANQEQVARQSKISPEMVSAVSAASLMRADDLESASDDEDLESRRADAGRRVRPRRLSPGAWQVASRYFFPRQSISYAEEVIVYLLIWAIMIVSSQLVRTDGHVRPDLVLNVVPAGVARWMEVFNCIAAIVFCGALVWYGRQVVDIALLIDEHSASDLRFPMWIYYAALPAGGLLMLIRYVIRLVGMVTGPGTMPARRPGGHELPGID